MQSDISRVYITAERRSNFPIVVTVYRVALLVVTFFCRCFILYCVNLFQYITHFSEQTHVYVLFCRYNYFGAKNISTKILQLSCR